jgi:hypothetical protein
MIRSSTSSSASITDPLVRAAGNARHRRVPPVRSVDAHFSRTYRRFRRFLTGALVALGAPALAASCAARAGGGTPLGPAVPAYEADAVARTAPKRSLHILFSWSLQESEARFSGRGATRLDAPTRARLDLFGPRGEAYLRAALVDMDLRLPQGAADAPLPPPELLWAVLGVFRPPVGAQLVGSARDGTTTRLEYQRDKQRWSFHLEDGVLRSAEWTGGGQGRRTIEIKGYADLGLPREAVYRDWLAFRELRLTLDEANETEGFPADIFTIGSR